MHCMKGLVYVSAPLYMGFTLLYLISRIYLVFEVFRNLTFLDPQVYQSPEVKNKPLSSLVLFFTRTNI